MAEALGELYVRERSKDGVPPERMLLDFDATADPMSKVSSPSNTKLHSSSREWVCGGIISPGGRRASMLVKAPPKASAVTLWVMRRVGR